VIKYTHINDRTYCSPPLFRVVRRRLNEANLLRIIFDQTLTQCHLLSIQNVPFFEVFAKLSKSFERFEN